MSRPISTYLSLFFILFVGLIIVACARPADDSASTAGDSASTASEGIHAGDIHKGNVICLLPDYDKGTVKPVVTSEPCHGKTPHAHVFLDTRTKEGNVYAVNASPEALARLEKGNKQDVEIAGTVSGNQRAWIITVE